MDKGFVYNKMGLRIKKCCASCDNKVVQPDGERRCRLIDSEVAKNEICSQYRLRIGYANGQRSYFGKVKTKEYIQFQLEWRDNEAANNVTHIATESDIKRVFLKTHKSVYRDGSKWTPKSEESIVADETKRR